VIELSIIVPAYNEEGRISPFLGRLDSFFSKRKGYEILLVDDGSRDGTLKLMRQATDRNNNLRIISYRPNKGKGHAVRQGVMAARGRKIIFIDADGSISPDEIPKMEKGLERYDVVIGSRTMSGAVVKKSLSRRLTSALFNSFTSLLFGIGKGDKLCGFKGFKRRVARELFSGLESRRFLFDIELLYKIRQRGYTLLQQPIAWTEKKGSKMGLFAPFRLFFELISLKKKLSRKG
jgi:dolichyl-phosphate beta-glucosyltransferase